MEFMIEKSSPIPVTKQIQAQIKLSIAMGVLKRGDILPSVREVEKQTGINRGQIHRAFLAMQQSGLLSLTPSKRIAIAISAAAPGSINKKCQELTKEIIQRSRRIGVPPIAYARYFSRSAQEDERISPFIAYVDGDKKTALSRADQVSQLWQVVVVGLSIDEFKPVLARRNGLRKVLVNHLAFDLIRTIPAKRKIDIIPIEIRYTVETIRALGKMSPHSSVLLIIPNHALQFSRFIVERLRALIKHRNVNISCIAVNRETDFDKLFRSSRYDRILVSPGAQNKLPLGQHPGSRILQLRMEFVPEGLEAARIRAGVII